MHLRCMCAYCTQCTKNMELSQEIAALVEKEAVIRSELQAKVYSLGKELEKQRKGTLQTFNVPTYEHYNGTVPVTVCLPFTIEEVNAALENVAHDCSKTAEAYKNAKAQRDALIETMNQNKECCTLTIDANIKLQKELETAKKELQEARNERVRLNERIAQLREENINVKLDNDALKTNRDSILEDMIACEDYISQKIKDWN